MRPTPAGSLAGASSEENMKRVIALQSFDHGGMRRRGDVFEVSPQTAEGLVRAGIVRLHDKADPSKAAGAKSSASPAAQASPRKTAKKSAAGAPEVKSEA